VYARKVGDRTLDFDLWPGLERGVLVMVDRQTHSLWSQLNGNGIKGPLTGQRLRLISTTISPWKSWSALHPDTTVYAGGSSVFALLGPDYSLGGNPQDHRGFVLGTRVGAATRAYPLLLLDRSPVLNDELGGVPIVIAYNPQEGFGVVWDRKIGDRELRFQRGITPFSARDDSGSTWDLLQGTATAGPLAGQHLAGRWVTLAYPHRWEEFFGAGSIYGE